MALAGRITQYDDVMDRGSVKILVGDAREKLREIPDETFQCCVTSPPYWGLRDYDYEQQIGAEEKIEDYISNLVGVFREVRRTLRSDGVLWLNIGDSYTSGNRKWRAPDKKNEGRAMSYRPDTPDGLKPKDLIGVPWKLAFALQADGWYLRSEVIWHKPNCQPESVRDRPTRSHEHVFLLTKSDKYFYDHDAVKEPAVVNGQTNGKSKNRRSVWNINTEGFKGAHFAVFPRQLVRLCILAGSTPGTTVLDPFLGSGTVGAVALETGRNCIGIEMKEDYADMARERISQVHPRLI